MLQIWNAVKWKEKETVNDLAFETIREGGALSIFCMEKTASVVKLLPLGWPIHNRFFPAAFAFFHLNLAAAAILALAAADILRRPFLAGCSIPLTFAQRSF